MPNNHEQQPSSRKTGWLILAGIAVFLLLFTGVISYLDLDRRVSSLFYTPGQGFTLSRQQPWEWLYLHGTTPGVLFLLGALALWFSGFFTLRLAVLQKHMLCIVLTGVISSGLLVNGVLKPYWGRPRPVEITSFGGEWQYRHALSPGTAGKGQSFPSGHAAMGFVFVPLLFFRKKSRAAFGAGLAGLGYGGLMSLTRVVQGAHFLTDVTWSLGITLATAAALYHLVLRIPESGGAPPPPAGPVRKVVYGLVFLAAAVGVSTFFLSRRPFFETYKKPLEINANIQSLVIHPNVECVRQEVRFEGERQSRVLIDSKGFGTPFVSRTVRQDTRYAGAVQNVYFEVEMSGRSVEMDHAITVILPKRLENRVRVEFAGPRG